MDELRHESDAKFNLSVPTFAVDSTYEVIEKPMDSGVLKIPAWKLEELRLSKLGISSSSDVIPARAGIPSVSDPSNVNFNYTVPGFGGGVLPVHAEAAGGPAVDTTPNTITAPPPVIAPAAENTTTATTSKVAGTPQLTTTTTNVAESPPQLTMTIIGQAEMVIADRTSIESPQPILETPWDELSPAKRAKELQAQPSEPPAFEDFIGPAPKIPVYIKEETFKDEDDDDDDENGEEESQQEEKMSFPRHSKRPKKPKRDQEDIPKVLFRGGGRLSTTTVLPPAKQKPHHQQQQPTPTVVAADSDIPKLLFEGVASLDTEEVVKALEILSQTFLQSPTKCTEAVDLGGHGILVVNMKKWQYNKKVQQLSCECIHNIVFNYRDGRVDIMEVLAMMGALEIILKSMDNFAESLGIQRFGFAALGNLLYGKGETLQTRARKCVQELDAITTVISGMRRFPKNVMVQGCGCIVLSGLFKLGNYKTKMAEAGVLLDVAAAVTNHPTNTLIEKEASSFMQHFFGWTAGGSSQKSLRG